MKKYLSISLIVLLGFVFSLSIYSSVKAMSGENDDVSNFPTNSELKQERTQRLNATKEKHDALKENIKTNREEFKTQMDAKREEMKNNRQAFVDELKTKRDAFKTEMEAKKEDWKNTKSEIKKEFCGKAKDMLVNRFRFAVNQLEKYQTKIDELITKLKADGQDTTLAQEALDNSTQKLADAKAKLAEVKGLVPENCENMTPDVFEKIKLGAREAKDLLKESREALHQAVKEIKILKGENTDDENKTVDSN